jgi:hypothetical protein
VYLLPTHQPTHTNGGFAKSLMNAIPPRASSVDLSIQVAVHPRLPGQAERMQAARQRLLELRPSQPLLAGAAGTPQMTLEEQLRVYDEDPADLLPPQLLRKCALRWLATPLIAFPVLHPVVDAVHGRH